MDVYLLFYKNSEKGTECKKYASIVGYLKVWELFCRFNSIKLYREVS